MKTLNIAVIATIFTTVCGFLNSAPVYIKESKDLSIIAPHYLSLSSFNNQLHQYEELVELMILVQLTKKGHMNLTKSSGFEQAISGFKIIPKVFYENEFEAENEGFKKIELGDVEGKTQGKYVGELKGDSEGLAVLRKVADYAEGKEGMVIIQVLPEIKQEQFYQTQKRDAKQVTDLDETFNKLIEDAKKEGGTVTIAFDNEIDDPKIPDVDDGSSPSKTPNIGDSPKRPNVGDDYKEIEVSGSLFETHQFFSSGILSATIVSLFLVFVLIQGLSWVSTMQISYRALERPFDGQKKTK